MTSIQTPRRSPHPATGRSASHRLARAAGAAALGLAAVLGAASPALAHDELIATDLVADAEGAPEAIELRFNNSIVEVGTEFIVESPDGADATDGPAQVAGPAVTQPLAADLAPGEYRAAWRVVSSDGHPIDGAFGLVVAADGTASLSESAPATESSEEHGHDGETAGAEEPSSVPVGALIAVAVGGAAVIAGGIAAATAGRRRRARGMAADAQAGAGDEQGGRA